MCQIWGIRLDVWRSTAKLLCGYMYLHRRIFGLDGFSKNKLSTYQTARCRNTGVQNIKQLRNCFYFLFSLVWDLNLIQTRHPIKNKLLCRTVCSVFQLSLNYIYYITLHYITYRQQDKLSRHYNSERTLQINIRHLQKTHRNRFHYPTRLLPPDGT